MDSQDAERRADEAMSQGQVDEGAEIYAELWQAATDPRAPDGSPSAWGVAHAMMNWSRRSPEVGDLWKPLVPASLARVESPDADYHQMSEFLLITEASRDDATLIAYFEGIAPDWRSVHRWKAMDGLGETAAVRLQLVGRPDLAQVFAPTAMAIEFDRQMEGIRAAIVAPAAPILAPMMAPK